MKMYLVGGAVRDKMLGLPVSEKDWVVVGATIDEMLNLGFRPVGKDFPVFLHPETYEEYALARTERKIGLGYKGFDFNASASVSLEDDLRRRDLTINAMAETSEGELIDPYHGKQDLEDRILRHVSQSFVEDPVRILRVARFASRFYSLGFKVAHETNELMKKMVLAGEVEALVAERVWKELERALKEKNPEQFFLVLKNCGALLNLFPQVKPEGISALKNAAFLTDDAEVRFAVLLHAVSEKSIEKLANRYRLPSNYAELAILVSRHGLSYQKAKELSATEILQLLQQLDAFRREPRFNKFLLACESFSPISNSTWLYQCYQASKSIDVQPLIAAGFTNKTLADKINTHRLEKIQDFISKN